MERPQDGCRPALKATLETLRRELEQLYQNVKSTCGERREQAPVASAASILIRGK